MLYVLKLVKDMGKHMQKKLRPLIVFRFECGVITLIMVYQRIVIRFDNDAIH